MKELIEKTWGWDETWQRDDFETRFHSQRVSVVDVEAQPVGGLWLEPEAHGVYVR
jgi:hypothetical protein